MKKLIVVVLILVFAAVGAGAWWYFTLPKTASVAEAAPTVPVVVGTVNVSVEAVSVAEPAATASLRNKSAGYIRFIAAEGTRVKFGEAVVVFDDADFVKARDQAELTSRQAGVALERSRATEAKARTDLGTRQALFQDKAATQEQVDAAKEALLAAQFGTRTAELTYEQAHLSIEQAKRDWAEATLRASIAGTMSRPALAAGDFAPTNSALGAILDTTKILFRAEVDEYDIGKLREGLAATVKVPALGDAVFRAKIDAISPAADVINSISVFRVSIVVDNTDGKLRPGMSADITILVSNEKGLLVPLKAVTTVRSRSYVDVSVPGGVVDSRRVSLGSNDGRNVVVTEGLEAGEAVLLPGAPMPVKVVPAAPPTGTSILPITVPGSGGR